MAGAWPVWMGRGGVETCICKDVLEGSECGLLVWSEVVEVACGYVWIDDLDRLGVVCAEGGEEGRHARGRHRRHASPERPTALGVPGACPAHRFGKGRY